MTLLTELGYLGIEASDLATWERFAAGVLGLGVAPGPTPQTRLLRMDEQRARFLLSEGPADDCVYAGWRVRTPADLEAYAKHLDGLGIGWRWGSDDELALRGVERMLHFADPTGTRHEAFCGPHLAHTPFCSPAVASAFVTGDGGLGHVVYASSDPKATIDFAQRALGLVPSDLIRLPLGGGRSFDILFMHMNERHHSFAVAPQLPVPGPKKRIHHFMVEVASVGEVGYARDRCLAMGQPVSMDIGQHTNDRMISFYGTTPSGFEVEFGYGGVLVEKADWQFKVYDSMSCWGHRRSLESSAAPARPPLDAAPPAAAAPASPNGNWKVVISTPMGENEAVFELKAEGASLVGAIKEADDVIAIQDGQADGAALRWNASVKKPFPMALEFSATVDGDRISGGAKSPFGTAPFSGTRIGA